MTATQDSPHPKEVDSQLARAKELVQTAQFDAAGTLLQNLLAAQPGPEEREQARYLLAVSKRYAGQMDSALETLQALLRDNPGHARAWQEQGHVFLSLNRGRRGRPCLRQSGGAQPRPEGEPAGPGEPA